MTARRKRRLGNAMVEFAIASAVLLPCMGGTFQFGYAFYNYNLLESAVANGTRYAAYRTYRSSNGSDIDKVKVAVRNMTVYGTPSPGQNPVPVVKGLTTANVIVNYTVDAKGIPLSVSVNVTNYKIKSVFKDFTMKGKPKLTLPYLGRYAPNESES